MFTVNALCVWIISVFLAAPCCWCWSASSTDRLRSHLLNSTVNNPKIRPSEQATVEVALDLITINEVSMLSQMMSVTGWFVVEWTDPRLNWTLADNDNISYVFMSDGEIWKPELFVDNSVVDVGIIQDSSILYRVSNTGRVKWQIPRIFQTHCEIIITYYPFDKQECSVHVTSWTYNEDELVLKHLEQNVDSDGLRPNGEWYFLYSRIEYGEIEDRSSAEGSVASQLIFSLILQRRSEFYIINVILPILLLSFLSICVFILPADSGEKISYSLTLLLTQAVFLSFIASSMPSTSINISILSIYLIVILIVGVLCVLATVFTITVYFKGESGNPPNWMQNMMACYLAPITCWSGHKTDKKYSPDKDNSEINGNASRSQNENEDGDLDDDVMKYTWMDMSAILDRFFLYMAILIVSVATAVFMAILVVGGRNANHIH